MDQKDFERLTSCCDAILRKFSDDIRIVAIPWLHVLNGHPNSLAGYKFGLVRRSFFSTWGCLLNHFFYSCYRLCCSLVISGEAALNSSKVFSNPEPGGVLFISHFVNAQQADDIKDFYFGTLPVFLQDQKKLPVLVGWIDHTPGIKKRAVTEKNESVKPGRILFPKSLSFSSELRIICKAFSSFKILRKASLKENDPVLSAVLAEASIQAFTPATFYELRIEQIVQKLLEAMHPQNLVITWEGRAWERLAISAAKNINPSIKCIGYQHTVLLQSSHALLQSMGKQYDSDLIVTIGETTASAFRSFIRFGKTEVAVFGSYRLQTKSKIDNHDHLSTRWLVTPEGIESECLLLFRFAMDLAKQLPGSTFVFRTHPVLPFTALAKKYPEFENLPPNCSISTHADINADFNHTDFLLYRGSSVAIYAVLKGLRPFYLSVPGEISIDPLYMLGNWKQVVANINETTTAIKHHDQLTETARQDLFNEAFAYCSSYTVPASEETFYQYLSHP